MSQPVTSTEAGEVRLGDGIERAVERRVPVAVGGIDICARLQKQFAATEPKYTAALKTLADRLDRQVLGVSGPTLETVLAEDGGDGAPVVRVWPPGLVTSCLRPARPSRGARGASRLRLRRKRPRPPACPEPPATKPSPP